MTIDHAAIACNNVDALREWYERVLGFEVRFRKPPSRPAGQPAYLVGPRGSAVAIELMGEDGSKRPERGSHSPGLSHLAFRVEDFPLWEALLSERGVAWTGPAGEALGGGRVRSFLDPEGNMLQIVER